MLKIIGICGESGCGKTTVINYLRNELNVGFIKETTTRPMRPEDKSQNFYHFTDKIDFDFWESKNQVVAKTCFNVKHQDEQWMYGFITKDIPINGVHIVQVNWQSLSALQHYFKNSFISVQIVRDDKQKLLSVLNRPDINIYEQCDRFCRDKKLYSELETDYIVENNGDIMDCIYEIYNKLIKG